MRNSITALFAAMAALAAPGAPIPVSAPPAPKVAAIDGVAHRTVDPGCDCATSYRTTHRYEGLSASPSRERAETSRLNQQFLESARAAARPSAPAPDAAQLAYQEQLKNYRVLSDSYERRMRDYNRLHAQADAGWQDAVRADPWHGYNPRRVNGY